MVGNVKSDEIESPWAPFETRRRTRDLKQQAVLQVAAQMFVERGYHRTTLNDVAERLSITKPALYNYFKSKEHILMDCWKTDQKVSNEILDKIDDAPISGIDKLREMISFYARNMMGDFGMCFAQIDVRELSDEARAEVRYFKRQIDTKFRRYIDEGIRDGSIVECDVKLAALAIGGSLTRIAFWYRAGLEKTPDEIAAEFVKVLTNGLARRVAG